MGLAIKEGTTDSTKTWMKLQCAELKNQTKECY
jgi:hypothetical protein